MDNSWNPAITNQGKPENGTSVIWDGVERLKFPCYMQEGSAGVAVRNLKEMVISTTFCDNFIVTDEKDRENLEEAINRLRPKTGHWDEFLGAIIRILQKSFGLDIDGNVGPATQAVIATLLGIQELQALPINGEEGIEHTTYAKHPDGYTISYNASTKKAIIM